MHNHPHATPDYENWNPDNVLALVKGHSKRIGACCDTGHWVRSGLDPVECLKKMEGRIISLHLKDVAECGQARGPRRARWAPARPTTRPCSRRSTARGFQGVMAIEYEHDSDELMDDVAQCVAFVEKTAKSL